MSSEHPDHKLVLMKPMPEGGRSQFTLSTLSRIKIVPNGVVDPF